MGNLEIGIRWRSRDFGDGIWDLGVREFEVGKGGGLMGIVEKLGVGYGDKVRGKRDIEFDMSGFRGLLVGFGGRERLNVKVRDEKGKRGWGILGVMVN